MSVALNQQTLPVRVAYQPVVQLSTPAGAVVSAYECLVRVAQAGIQTWEMIQQAEREGSMPILDKRIARLACSDAFACPEMRIWLNLSQLTMSCPASMTEIITLITSHARPSQVIVEMTETASGSEPQIIDALVRLRAAGIHVVLDDIGDGYSRSHLLRTDLVRGCKISRETTVQLRTNPRKLEEVARLVEWCRRHGKSVVMEGIETEEELNLAQNLGVDYCQGYLFWPALDLSDLPKAGYRIHIPNWEEAACH